MSLTPAVQYPPICTADTTCNAPPIMTRGRCVPEYSGEGRRRQLYTQPMEYPFYLEAIPRRLQLLYMFASFNVRARNEISCRLSLSLCLPCHKTNHPLPSDATNSALYLRTLLRVLDWAAVNAYDVRALLTKMLTIATSVGALYNVFFDR